MPDISMCAGGVCPIRHNCYRFTAKPGARQSYFMEVPYHDESGACSYFIEAKAKSQVRRLDAQTGRPSSL